MKVMFEFRFVKKATFVSEICIVEIASTIEAHDIVLESRDEQLSSRLSSGAQLHARQGGRAPDREFPPYPRPEPGGGAVPGPGGVSAECFH